MSFSVIIPTRNSKNVLACVSALRRAGEEGRIILVDDGLDEFPPGCDVICGVKDFIFARNVNIGIRAAGRVAEWVAVGVDANGFPQRTPSLLEYQDVILLNDDALLQTPGGFTAMAAVARDHSEYGLIAATTNVTGNLNQLPKGIGLREDPRQVCFICVYIPRTTIEKVGLLDERFVDYGCEDDDYCLRVRKAGLKLGIFDGCYVDHGSLTSSFRGGPRAGGDYMPNMKRFIAKWGHDNFGRPCRA
ncbi:MAG: hypothetical protein ABIH23_19245 [bacterium]